MKNKTQYFLCLLFLTCIGLNSCTNDMTEIQKIVQRDEVNIETARDVKLLYSDSAVVRVQVTAPTMLRHLDNNDPRAEFVDGVQVDFFGPDKKISGTLTAKYAIRYDDKQEVLVRDSVVWNSRNNERLETEELIWNEKTRKVYSKKFVKITNPEEVMYGYGFEGNQDFTQLRIEALVGTMKVEGLSEEVNR